LQGAFLLDSRFQSHGSWEEIDARQNQNRRPELSLSPVGDQF
jgi:hypothetical protein